MSAQQFIHLAGDSLCERRLKESGMECQGMLFPRNDIRGVLKGKL